MENQVYKNILSKFTDNTPLVDLDISVRTYNRARENNCTTLGDLRKFYDQIASGEKIKGVGKMVAEEIDSLLEDISEAQLVVLEDKPGARKAKRKKPKNNNSSK